MVHHPVSTNIRIFEREMYSLLRSNHLLRIVQLPDRDGLELSLPTNMDVLRAERVASVIRKKYQLTAHYFHRTNTIKVYYEILQ